MDDRSDRDAGRGRDAAEVFHNSGLSTGARAKIARIPDNRRGGGPPREGGPCLRGLGVIISDAYALTGVAHLTSIARPTTPGMIDSR